jgi:hypothetical protein
MTTTQSSPLVPGSPGNSPTMTQLVGGAAGSPEADLVSEGLGQGGLQPGFGHELSHVVQGLHEWAGAVGPDSSGSVGADSFVTGTERGNPQPGR